MTIRLRRTLFIWATSAFSALVLASIFSVFSALCTSSTAYSEMTVRADRDRCPTGEARLPGGRGAATTLLDTSVVSSR